MNTAAGPHWGADLPKQLAEHAQGLCQTIDFTSPRFTIPIASASLGGSVQRIAFIRRHDAHISSTLFASADKRSSLESTSLRMRRLPLLIFLPLLCVGLSLSAEALLSNGLGCKFDYDTSVSPCSLFGWDVSASLFLFGMVSFVMFILSIPTVVAIALFSLTHRSKRTHRRQPGLRP